ncbi:SpoIID/LytB domain-containing protein [Actinocorallia sp. A-T 12471]|uniref:SpoIID/LytB domain-containing protein n=1 Tax=Actinocorallia sp. A-T 12471 TaxID=3089813 RepID=UPI0029CF7D68|nr:SpoIID/LytB domain-containing protein [Actinocorallia sp. A-T 12471]MDX6742000.1 SpoIID/LytB domain-containing protein [Actinocorallia sp. A-T 12471]
MTSRIIRTLSRFAATAAAMAVGGMVLATAAPVSAASRNGVCQTGEFCYYFNSNNKGSVSDFSGSVADYGTKQPSCYDFKGAGNGKGKCIKNEAASVWNRSAKTVRVYFNSKYKGAYQDFRPGAKGNLETGLKNQNASHKFLSSTPTTPTGCKTDGTHTKPPSTILVYRASLNRVERVAFKTYVKNVLPNEWYASWPKESLRAGAIAVKNYGWYWALHSTRKTASGKCFDVWDHTNSQVYKPGSAQPSTSAAVDATWGKKLTRGGKIYQAQYCATTTACSSWWVDGEWMSQQGSRDRARSGWSHSKILKYYYKGVTLK